MNLANLKTKRAQGGFTIVELLIVIVVIGILAAIVIVAYNGVTTKANDSADAANAQSLDKVAEAVNADLSTGYPWGNSDATLKTAFNADSTTTSIPQGLGVIYIASTGAAPSYASANTAAASKNYYVKVCSAAAPNSTGLNVYYPKRSDSSVQVIKAGTGCN
ncbi:MAG: type II secretion system protein [Candidatus Nomurabacteria bacterium]|nr:MAG: type II secretion system protein [Candidatus Nomurabacteria bacterium]